MSTEDSDNKEIQKNISKPMSDTDLERFVGIKPGEIIKYSDLANYKRIEDLLPADKSFKIILIEDKYNSGHWVALLRYGQTCEYFNSYGAKWDTDWKFISRMIRVILGESTNEMTRLMTQAEADGFKTIWNKTRFQKLASWVQTCGKWCVLRVEMMRMGYSLDEFASFVRKKTKELNKPNDFLVSKMIKN